MMLKIAESLMFLSVCLSVPAFGYLIARYFSRRAQSRSYALTMDFSGMQYERRDDGISGPSIPYDNSWDDLTKLSWHAAVYNAQIEEVTISVCPAEYLVGGVRQREVFNIGVTSTVDARSSVSGPFDLDAGWTYINGISTGADMVRPLTHEV